MFEKSDEGFGPDMDKVLSSVFSIGKWLLVILAVLFLLVAPALVLICRKSGDLDSDGGVTRAEYDEKVSTLLGTFAPYLTPAMSVWERVIFLLLPLETAEA